MRDRGGYIVKWNTPTWKRISSKYVVRDPMSAFSVSNDGKFLAIGTIQGDVHILNSSNMKVHTVVKKAHLGLVTALAFSSDSRALASASLDSTARVTLIKEATKSVTFDIVEAILLLCDVKDLLQNQSVCKEWCKLISSSCFVKTHHEFVCNKEDNTRKISMITLYMSGERVPEEWRSYDRWSMEGSCNGLVLLRKKDDILCANPVTRLYRRFSSPKRESKEKQCFGFGYDSSSDDYKVVMASSNMSQFHIFSLKSNIWKLWGSKEKGIPVEKKKKKIKYWFDDKELLSPGILFNGALHWFWFKDYTRKNVLLVSFDLATEEFTAIPHPDDERYNWNCGYRLGIIEGCLCILPTDDFRRVYDNPFLRDYDNPLREDYDEEQPFPIWVMKSDNSWELFPNSSEMKDHAVHFMLKDGD